MAGDYFVMAIARMKLQELQISFLCQGQDIRSSTINQWIVHQSV